MYGMSTSAALAGISPDNSVLLNYYLPAPGDIRIAVTTLKFSSIQATARLSRKQRPNLAPGQPSPLRPGCIDGPGSRGPNRQSLDIFRPLPKKKGADGALRTHGESSIRIRHAISPCKQRFETPCSPSLQYHVMVCIAMFSLQNGTQNQVCQVLYQISFVKQIQKFLLKASYFQEDNKTPFDLMQSFSEETLQQEENNQVTLV